MCDVSLITPTHQQQDLVTALNLLWAEKQPYNYFLLGTGKKGQGQVWFPSLACLCEE